MRFFDRRKDSKKAAKLMKILQQSGQEIPSQLQQIRGSSCKNQKCCLSDHSVSFQIPPLPLGPLF